MRIYSEFSKENTLPTLELALEKAQELNAPIVVATTGGDNALKLAQLAKERGFSQPIVAVTHCFGFARAGENEVSPETFAAIEAAGLSTVTAAHSLSGAERTFGAGVNGPATLMAQTLRMFSQGVKVCVEVSAMALDAGKLPFGREVVAIAGTDRGADTAMVLTPAYTAQLLKTRIHELLCMPRP